MNFQTSKRIMCCLMAALILCCAVVRPIEASAMGLGETAAAAALIGITDAQAIAGILTALGIGYLASTDFEELAYNLADRLPTEFILRTMDGTEMVEATLYQDVIYVGQELVEWVNKQLYANLDGEESILYARYNHSGEWLDYYKQAETAFWDSVALADDYNYCTYLTYENGTKELIYSNAPVKIAESTSGTSFDKFSVNGCVERFVINADGILSGHFSNEKWYAGVSWQGDFSSVTRCEPTSINARYTDNLKISDRISTILNGQTYVEWLANALTLADTTTAVLPISLGNSINDTGAISQTVAQTGTVALPGIYIETDEYVDVVVPSVGADLSGIIALLKTIIEVLKNIYQTCAVSIKSWIEANADAIIAANYGIIDANAANTQAILDALSDSDWYIGQKLYDLTTVLSNTYTKVSQIHALISTITDKIITAISDVSSKIADPIVEAVTAVKTQIVNSTSGIIQQLGNAISSVRTAISMGITTITDTITDTIAQVIEKLLALGLTLADILSAIKALATTIADAIAEALSAVFVPSADFITSKVEALRARFDWINPFMDFAKSLSFSGSEPPVIYIHLDAAEGSYYFGGTIPFLDMRWYSRYKATGDAIISGFLWMLFGWRMYLKLPGIISGVGGTVGHISR